MIRALLVLLTFASLNVFAGPQPKNAAVWFEIPVGDMSRAVKFYEAVLATHLEVQKGTTVPMALFPGDEGYGSAGALMQMPALKPGADGTIVYLNGGEDLQPALDRVVPAGGKVLIGKTLINENVGYFAMFLDTEGNRLGLFSAK